MEKRQSGQKGLNGYTLKWIAAVAMLCSHIYKCLLVSHREFLVLDMIGRIAFPIFCFLLVEGFCHTSNRRAYLCRLWIFAVCSEIPFNLAFFGKLYAPEAQNVLLTMLVGLLVLMGMEHLKGTWRILPLGLGMAVAWFCHMDYGFWGIWIIACFYVLRGMKQEWFLLQAVNALVSMIWFGWIQFFSLLALPLLFIYNGQSGTKRKGTKYIFYIFYPLHMILLVVIRYLVLGLFH